MQGNREEGDLHDRYEVENPGFELSEETRKFLLMLFVFSIIFFLIMYQRVYGSTKDTPQD